MASLMSRLSRFARSPQGRKAADQAKRFAKDPKNRRRVEELRTRFARKR